MDEEFSEKLPYRAEYAKSGRSNCKACKTSIGKDELRLAAMVQSPMFDGTVPNWYHFTCFFIKQRPKSVGDIAHVDSLRWDDQEKIKTKLSEVSGEPVPTKGGKKPSKRSAASAKSSAFKDYIIEYAKSSRAMCRGCEIKISKNEVRISKKDFESENARMYGGQDRWHHVECFSKLRNSLGFYESGDLLPGFMTLKEEDQKKIKDELPKIDPPTEVKDETDGPPPEKKVKTESSNVKTKVENDEMKKQNKQNDEMKKQNKTMFKYRDYLKELSRPQLTRLLNFNNQEDPSGIDRKLDRLADVMTFGALLPCDTCNGQFVYRTSIGYQCLGDVSEWSKCQKVEENPKRTKFLIPEDLAKKFSFLEKYKCKLGNRIMLDVKPSTSTENGAEINKIERFAPFKDMNFFIVGKTKTTKAELKKKIELWGGRVATKLSPEVALVISNKDEVERLGHKMQEVKDFNIHVVPETFIEACKEGNALDKISEMTLSSWGADPKTRVQAIIQKSVNKSKSSSRFTKKSGSKVTLKLKGGSAVDPDSGLDEVAHVYKEKGDLYNCILGLSDVQNNRNSYYKIQLLISDDGKDCFIWRAWGRIGTTIGGSKLEKMSDIVSAKTAFKALFEEKTGNEWKHRDNFVKVPNCMYPIDVDYGETDIIKMPQNSTIESKLPKQVQDLVSMLFDVDVMQKVMLEFELDLEKMPLGKLSRKQIQKAYSVLSELQQKDGDFKPSLVIDATNRFYTLIPHDFGTDAPPLLNSKEIIQGKLEMLESLLEMEIAYSLLKETKTEGDSTMHPLDAHYAKLNTQIEVLDKDSFEFGLFKDYVANTHAQTHSNYTLDIIEIFKVSRNGEDKRYKPFKKLHNRKLLWHGSRITNFAGILSQGLRIAPPEAPVTGYMFGKGVYFADMVSKSANYCMTSMANPEGLLLLCEVALGNMYERTHADYIEKLPPGMHSTKGIGATEPDPQGVYVLPDGTEVPLGKGVQSLDRSKTTLLYNEYIVYDVAQVKVQYLLKVGFKYN